MYYQTVLYGQLAHWDDSLTHLIGRPAHMLSHAIRSTLTYINYLFEATRNFSTGIPVIYINNANNSKLNM